jgi:hypothetical protein
LKQGELGHFKISPPSKLPTSAELDRKIEIDFSSERGVLIWAEGAVGSCTMRPF